MNVCGMFCNPSSKKVAGSGVAVGVGGIGVGVLVGAVVAVAVAAMVATGVSVGEGVGVLVGDGVALGSTAPGMATRSSLPVSAAFSLGAGSAVAASAAKSGMRCAIADGSRV